MILRMTFPLKHPDAPPEAPERNNNARLSSLGSKLKLRMSSFVLRVNIIREGV